jgi:hypothetical protein
MKLEITVTDDTGNVQVYQQADPMHPVQWRPSNPEKPITDGKYYLHGFTYQPIVTHVPLQYNR